MERSSAVPTKTWRESGFLSAQPHSCRQRETERETESRCEEADGSQAQHGPCRHRVSLHSLQDMESDLECVGQMVLTVCDTHRSGIFQCSIVTSEKPTFMLFLHQILVHLYSFVCLITIIITELTVIDVLFFFSYEVLNVGACQRRVSVTIQNSLSNLISFYPISSNLGSNLIDFFPFGKIR